MRIRGEGVGEYFGVGGGWRLSEVKLLLTAGSIRGGDGDRHCCLAIQLLDKYIYFYFMAIISRMGVLD